MRKPFSDQQRLDCDAIENVSLNLNCRDEIIPILAAGPRHSAHLIVARAGELIDA
jgi:hypothetical protein